MAKKKPHFFSTVSDMRALPTDKIDHFCEDLRLWLHMHKQAEAIQKQIDDALGGGVMTLHITTPTESFGWIDDGRHDARIKVDLSGLSDLLASETPPAEDAVDPSDGSAGTPPTRDKVS